MSEPIPVDKAHAALHEMGYSLLSNVGDRRVYYDVGNPGVLISLAVVDGVVDGEALFVAVEHDGGNPDVLQAYLESL